MILNTLSAALLVAVATQTAGPQLRVIHIDPSKPRSVFEVNVTPRIATTISLPESWAAFPTCGNCVFGDQPINGQLWRLDVEEATRVLVIKPTRLPGPDAPPSKFFTNVDVTLASGVSITLFVRLVADQADADARIEFRLPTAATAKGILAAELDQLRASFAQRVKRKATSLQLKAALAGTTCTDFHGRPNRHKLIVVRLKQICRNGAITWVTFTIENRARKELDIASATLTEEDGMSGNLYNIVSGKIRYDVTTEGIAALKRLDPSAPPSTYSLTITEDGGKERVVELDGISF